MTAAETRWGFRRRSEAPLLSALQPGTQLRCLMRYRANVPPLKEELLESDAATHLIEFGVRKGTIIGAVMLLCGVHFSVSTLFTNRRAHFAIARLLAHI